MSSREPHPKKKKKKKRIQKKTVLLDFLRPFLLFCYARIHILSLAQRYLLTQNMEYVISYVKNVFHDLFSLQCITMFLMIT